MWRDHSQKLVCCKIMVQHVCLRNDIQNKYKVSSDRCGYQMNVGEDMVAEKQVVDTQGRVLTLLTVYETTRTASAAVNAE